MSGPSNSRVQPEQRAGAPSRQSAPPRSAKKRALLFANHPPFSFRTALENGARCPRLVYIRDVAQADFEVAQLAQGPFGFDMEWRPTYVKGQGENPTALIQLANANTILLIQISAMSKFPEALQRLLENAKFLKIGAGIQGDVKKLFTDFGISTRGCVDLSLLARSADNARWKGPYSQPIGLAKMVEQYQHRSLTKGKVRMSNWEALLSEDQQSYAANDAFSGYVLYVLLEAMCDSLPRRPSTDCYSFNAINGSFYEPCGMLWKPVNPDYDPGPPPPPRPPKDPNDPKEIKKARRKAAQAGASGSQSGTAAPADVHAVRRAALPPRSIPANPSLWTAGAGESSSTTRKQRYRPRPW